MVDPKQHKIQVPVVQPDKVTRPDLSATPCRKSRTPEKIAGEATRGLFDRQREFGP